MPNATLQEAEAGGRPRECELTAAIINEDVASVVRLLRRGVSVPSNVTGRTPLMIAVHSSTLQIVTCLLQAGCDANAADNRSGRTVLMYALARRPGRVERGERVERVERDERFEVISAILSSGCDVMALDDSGMSAADYLIHHFQGDPRTLTLLLDRGCPLTYYSGRGGLWRVKVVEYCLTSVWRSCYDAEVDSAAGWYQRQIDDAHRLIRKLLTGGSGSVVEESGWALGTACWMLYLAIQKEDDDKPVPALVEGMARVLWVMCEALSWQGAGTLGEVINTPCVRVSVSGHHFTTLRMMGHTPAEMMVDCVLAYHCKYHHHCKHCVNDINLGQRSITNDRCMTLMTSILARFMDVGAHIDTPCYLRAPSDTSCHLSAPSDTSCHLSAPSDTSCHLSAPCDKKEKHIRHMVTHSDKVRMLSKCLQNIDVDAVSAVLERSFSANSLQCLCAVSVLRHDLHVTHSLPNWVQRFVLFHTGHCADR